MNCWYEGGGDQKKVRAWTTDQFQTSGWKSQNLIDFVMTHHGRYLAIVWSQSNGGGFDCHHSGSQKGWVVCENGRLVGGVGSCTATDGRIQGK